MESKLIEAERLHSEAIGRIRSQFNIRRTGTEKDFNDRLKKEAAKQQRLMVELDSLQEKHAKKLDNLQVHTNKMFIKQC